MKDMYNISDNPQYRLELKNPGNSPAAVWILLTRHITDKVCIACCLHDQAIKLQSSLSCSHDLFLLLSSI